MLNSLDIAKRPQDTRVVVAMSGGVDSSVVAGLLAREGYDVVGVTLQLYDHGEATHRKGACCAGRDIHDARTVAAALGIPHYVLDYASRFKEEVIDRFAESYVSGETPVPCIACNQSIKFRDLLDTAKDLGAQVMATGHYISSRALPGGGRGLYRAREEERDQSYFLFATTREQLAFLRFPLGALDKGETRRLAARFALAVNRALGRRGPLLRERYHLRVLSSPTQVRNALRYVLLNVRKHWAQRRGSRELPGPVRLDPASSARWFRGWRPGTAGANEAARTADPPPVRAPRTWLLAVGWRRLGLLDPAEVPG